MESVYFQIGSYTKCYQQVSDKTTIFIHNLLTFDTDNSLLIGYLVFAD